MMANDEEHGGYRNKHGPIPLHHFSNDHEYKSREELEAAGHGPQLRALEKRYFARAEELKAPNVRGERPAMLDELLSNISSVAEQKLKSRTARQVMKDSPWVTEEIARRLYGLDEDTPLDEGGE